MKRIHAKNDPAATAATTTSPAATAIADESTEAPDAARTAALEVELQRVKAELTREREERAAERAKSRADLARERELRDAERERSSAEAAAWREENEAIHKRFDAEWQEREAEMRAAFEAAHLKVPAAAPPPTGPKRYRAVGNHALVVDGKRVKIAHGSDLPEDFSLELLPKGGYEVIA